jgi:hypothetical protein
MAKMKPGDFCPLIKKDCMGIKCSWFTQMRGTNPNTGEPVDEWGCAVTWMPFMAVEIAQKSNQTGAAVESFRNEVVKSNNENQQLYLDSIEKMEKGIIPATVTPLNPVINLLTSNDMQEEDKE